MQNDVPFNRPYMTGRELYNIAQSHFDGRLAGDGSYTKKCHAWIEKQTGCAKALLTHSCTGALEMSALLLNIEPLDEIIVPSYTFVSTANAFVLRGAVPVFIDVRADTLNIDERLIEDAITPRTKAIAPVHYAGVACEMDTILNIAKRYNVKVVEDAAQGIFCTYKGRSLGSIGDLGTYSFHETKNVISGEGGALLVNDPTLIGRAEIMREKGTDRSRFFRGEIDKYTWQDIGSSFLPGELTAAFLFAQLEEGGSFTKQRLESWHYYHYMLEPLEKEGMLRRPFIPKDCVHNAHLYYILISSEFDTQYILNSLKKEGINAISHYVALHDSPGGKKYGRAHGAFPVTDEISKQLIRLPLWIGLSKEQQERVVLTLKKVMQDLSSRVMVA